MKFQPVDNNADCAGINASHDGHICLGSSGTCGIPAQLEASPRQTDAIKPDITYLQIEVLKAWRGPALHPREHQLYACLLMGFDCFSWQRRNGKKGPLLISALLQDDPQNLVLRQAKGEEPVWVFF